MRWLWILLLVGCLGIAASAWAEDEDEIDPNNPCQGALGNQLLCPNLRMSAPYDLRTEWYHGKLMLRAASSVNSRGKGPAMLRGKRAGRYTMDAKQLIQKRHGKPMVVDTGAKLHFKFIPGQGRYWKFFHAARFELWKVDRKWNLKTFIRYGPKVTYCLRDLKFTKEMPYARHHQVFPGCSQNPYLQQVVLGTSVGWSDIYPAPYHEQWIDITGLRGTYALIHTVDPRNGIWESEEHDNQGMTIVKLPQVKILQRVEGLPEYHWKRPLYPKHPNSY